MAANPKQPTGHTNPILPNDDTFKLVAETRKHVDEIAGVARKLIKTHYTNPQALADFIARYQTPVFVLPGGLLNNMLIWALGVEQGFVPPSTGRRYRLLQDFLYWRTGKQQQSGQYNANQNGLFVLTRPLFTVGFMSHQLHHWLAFRTGMQGYSKRSQDLYRKFWHEHHGMIWPEVYKMSANDLMALKEAINRDLEALQFIKAVAAEILVPAKQSRLIGQGNASA